MLVWAAACHLGGNVAPYVAQKPFGKCDWQDFFLGNGGIFGLLQALVGEALPGSARCVAVGNALLQGPVIFHIPQYVVGRIKDRAGNGDQDVMQLLVDMYR